MLILTRKRGESIMIRDDIEIQVLSVAPDKVRLGIRAPRRIPVFRKEIYVEIAQENPGRFSRAEVDDALKRLTDRS
jgi:carbon storage regulator